MEGTIVCLNSEAKMERTVHLKTDFEKVFGTVLFDFEKASQAP